MSRRRRPEAAPGIVLSPAMTEAQLQHLLDLRRGSRSAPHLTARQRAARRDTKAGRAWKKEVW